MKTKCILIALLVASLMSISCRQQTVSRRSTVPLVKDILSDKYNPYHILLSSHSRPDPNGDIYIIGSESSCGAIAEVLTIQDEMDNVDGSYAKDGLRDFAGETISCIVDSMTSHYPSLLFEHKESIIRERCVRLALSAMDTLCHLSPYDLDGLGRKLPAKLIVLADPSFSAYGNFDVDTLFQSVGCAVPVVNSLDLMFGRIFAQAKTRPIRVAVLCEARFADSGLYHARFSKAMQEVGNKGSECIVIPSRVDGDGVMKAFLDDYMRNNPSKRLDCIVVDDMTLKVPELKSELASLISIMHEESMTYGLALMSGFTIVDPTHVLSEYCYSTLRKNNLFTHNISNPQSAFYFSYQKPASDDRSIILIPGNYVQN